MSKQTKKTKAGAHAAAAEPAAEASDGVLAPPATEQKVSGMEAVRQALAAGVDKPKEAVEYIKAKYGLDMKPQMFSSYKSNVQKKALGVRPGGGGKRPLPGGIMGLADSFTSLRALVSQYGADEVRRLIDVV